MAAVIVPSRRLDGDVVAGQVPPLNGGRERETQAKTYAT